MPIPYPSRIRYGSTHEAAGTAIWPDPPDRRCGFHNHTDPEAMSRKEQLLNGRAPAVPSCNKFHNKKESSLFNPSRGRSDRQGGRSGDNHRRTTKCH